MKLLIKIIIVLAAFVLPVAAQPRFAGKVVEAIDGRTLLVDTNSGKMRVRLQYVEVPEPDQAFAAVAKDHLSRLSVGKVIEFRPVRLVDNMSIGEVKLGGVDLSLQLIRDGAAWHEPAGSSGQTAASAGEYASNQQQAKAEKLGVWSAPNLKTPEQSRAETSAAASSAYDAPRRPSRIGLSEFQSDNRRGADGVASWAGGTGKSDLDSWGDLFAGVGKETYGLKTYSDPQGRFDTVYTSVAFVNMDGGKIDRRLEFRGIFIYLNLPDGQKQSMYMIGFQSVADEYYFSKRKSHLSFAVDKKNLAVGAPLRGLRAESSVGTREIVYYRVSKATLKSVAAGKTVEIRIDGLLGTIPQDIRDLFKQLVDTMD